MSIRWMHVKDCLLCTMICSKHLIDYMHCNYIVSPVKQNAIFPLFMANLAFSYSQFLHSFCVRNISQDLTQDFAEMLLMNIDLNSVKCV